MCWSYSTAAYKGSALVVVARPTPQPQGATCVSCELASWHAAFALAMSRSCWSDMLVTLPLPVGPSAVAARDPCPAGLPLPPPPHSEGSSSFHSYLLFTANSSPALVASWPSGERAPASCRARPRSPSLRPCLRQCPPLVAGAVGADVGARNVVSWAALADTAGAPRGYA